MEKPKSMQPIPEHAKTIFNGKFFDVVQWEQEMFDGSKKIFEKVKRPDTVDVIALTEDNKIIILKEQQPGKDVFYTLPGGRIEENENPMEAAKREMQEETGYTTDQISLWHSYQMTSKVEWALYFFIAKNCKKISQQELDGGEKIKILLVSVEEFLDMILKQKIVMPGLLMKMLEENLLVVDKEKSLENMHKHFI